MKLQRGGCAGACTAAVVASTTSLSAPISVPLLAGAAVWVCVFYLHQRNVSKETKGGRKQMGGRKRTYKKTTSKL